MLYLLPQAVDLSAERDPDKAALRCRGKSMSYGELARRSNALARALVGLGVERGDRIGIFARKGIDAAVALYGIMKAGACYVPLDPLSPVTRVHQILESCSMKGIVTEPPKRADVSRLFESVPSLAFAIGIAPGDDIPHAMSWVEVEASAREDSPPDVGTIEQDLSYILFTSGSTGTPKGIMHTHRSALCWAEVSAKTYGLTEDDRLSNHAPLHFDLSTLDYFAAAVAGATTVIIPEEYTKLPASLSKLMSDERLTVFYSVPLALIQLLLRGALDTRDLSSLRWVLFGGEPFPTKHLRALMNELPQARFSNVYGPTEVNGCTYFEVPTLLAHSNAPVPIGRPYPNVEALIIDEDETVITDDAIGELLIRAPTMMLGYWGNPELTARSVYERSRFGVCDDRFHRTGDLVQMLSDGNLRFVGRKDRQVKVRGHRVELDEIESVLASHDAVAEAAAYLVAGGDERQTLHATAILKAAAPTTNVDLEKYLRGLLPSYAIPESIEILEAFPRTSTGKIDRRELQRRADMSASSELSQSSAL